MVQVIGDIGELDITKDQKKQDRGQTIKQAQGDADPQHDDRPNAQIHGPWRRHRHPVGSQKLEEKGGFSKKLVDPSAGEETCASNDGQEPEHHSKSGQ